MMRNKRGHLDLTWRGGGMTKMLFLCCCFFTLNNNKEKGKKKKKWKKSGKKGEKREKDKEHRKKKIQVKRHNSIEGGGGESVPGAVWHYLALWAGARTFTAKRAWGSAPFEAGEVVTAAVEKCLACE